MQTLEQKEAADPEAYHFDSLDAAETPQTASSEELSEAFVGKAALLGVDIHLRGNFFCRPPKLKQEKMLVRGQEKLCEGEVESALDLLADAVLSLLHVREGDALRPATLEDIEEAFDSGELMAILSGALGVKFTETESGN